MKKVLLLSLMLVFIFRCDNTDFMTMDEDLVVEDGMDNFKGLEQDRYVVLENYNDLNVHYKVIGKPDKKKIDVVFIPGWTNPLTVYSKQFNYFRGKTRSIYIDLPGTGLSDAPTPNTPLAPIPGGPEYTMEMMADAIKAVLDQEEVEQFVGVGFSMGPKVLGMFERNYPGMIEKLVVLDGSFDPWPENDPERGAYIAEREGTYYWQLTWDEGIKQYLASVLVPPNAPQELIDLVTYFYTFPSDVLANTQYHATAENANEPLGWEYPKLCIYSRAVEELNMDKVNLIFPNNEVYGFPGGGHVIQWVFYEEINDLIWEFIKDNPGSTY